MADLDSTRYVKIDTDPRMGAEMVLATVYEALVEKGYNPINQLVGYIMSGDPTYITSYKGARSIITKVDREDLLEELLNHYMG
ncbi:MAG: IreB family regulatory phosphoprotein [Lachnospiraceae bacterium]|nr:IreB family regulatory phosphoprotein [Lachnospiraceae bacterium]